jgi:DNA repair protein RadA/Sms
MAKPRRVFACGSCGAEYHQWAGQCTVCREWNTLTERPSDPGVRGLSRNTRSVAFENIDTTNDDRLSSKMAELDRVLGGGLVQGSLVLLAGDPGIGKSTLVLRIAANIAEQGRSCLYVAAEESAPQIRMRASRMGIVGDGLYIYPDISVEGALVEASRVKAGMVIVDSIQTVRADDLDSAPGSVSQVREATLRLLHHAKTTQTPILIVGHVTKEGTVAGPRMLEHIVDTVLYLEGDDRHAHRLLRAVKNRFGPSFEVGVFKMDSSGLVEVSNPSAMLLDGRDESASGSAVAVAMEGSRPLLVEIQALAAPTSYSLPRRLATGLDLNRLNMLLAVLAQRANIGLTTHDVYVNVVGGLRLREPATDLAIAMAIASSHADRPIKSGTVAIGEIGLTGELRTVTSASQRIDEAARLGFKRCVVPEGTDLNGGSEKTFPASNLRQAIDMGLT